MHPYIYLGKRTRFLKMIIKYIKIEQVKKNLWKNFPTFNWNYNNIHVSSRKIEHQTDTMFTLINKWHKNTSDTIEIMKFLRNNTENQMNIIQNIKNNHTYIYVWKNMNNSLKFLKLTNNIKDITTNDITIC